MICNIGVMLKTGYTMSGTLDNLEFTLEWQTNQCLQQPLQRCHDHTVTMVPGKNIWDKAGGAARNIAGALESTARATQHLRPVWNAQFSSLPIPATAPVDQGKHGQWFLCNSFYIPWPHCWTLYSLSCPYAYKICRHNYWLTTLNDASCRRCKQYVDLLFINFGFFWQTSLCNIHRT